MRRFCYISQVLPGKSSHVRSDWKNNKKHISFWKNVGATGFESWLQTTSDGDFLIHCLEGAPLEQIFQTLKNRMANGDQEALKVHHYYQDGLIKPHIESLLDLSLSSPFPPIKRGFFYPLLPDQEDAHRCFRQEAMGPKRNRHEAMMQAFGVAHLSTWLQKLHDRAYIIVYTERRADTPVTPEDRLKQGHNCPEWQEIASILASHTGLKLEELSPDSEWLTQSLEK